MFRANVYGPLDTGMVWLYYNYAAGSFHTKKLCSKLYFKKQNIHQKTRFLSHPLGDLRVTYTLHL